MPVRSVVSATWITALSTERTSKIAFIGIEDAVPDDRIDLHRDIVLGDGFLLLDGGRHGAQIDLALPFEEWNEPIRSGAAQAVVSPETKDNSALILVGNSDARQRNDHDDRNDHNCKIHGQPPVGSP